MDEMRHTEQLVDRIVYFDAIPNLNKIGRIKVGKTVREQFELALDLEVAQVDRINAAIAVCTEHGDDGTRLVLEPMVTAGEASIDWLETQLAALTALGDSAYLAQQLT
jgi:bacterioferritin